MTFPSLIPPGWLRDYISAMDEARNEMPLPFHFLAACVTVGHMMGLDTWGTLARGVRVFPNVNVMLLSPAGKCRRGEGTKITMAIAKGAGVNVLSGRTTPEGLVAELMEHGDTLLYAEELSMLLTKADYQRHIIPVLTKLLLHGEGAADVRTMARGKQVLPRVNLSALFTSAPDWFMSTIPEEAFGGGLMSRFIVCCMEERTVHHIDIRADDEASREVQDKLTQSLLDMPIPKGHMKGTKEAQEWIVPWYEENEQREVKDPRLAPHRNRKPANLLRLAMILAATSGEGVVTKEMLEHALALLNWFEPTLLKLYGMTDDVVDGMNKGERRVVEILAPGEVKHSVLMRKCGSYFKGGVLEFRRCMEGLTEKRLVQPVFNGVARAWPPLSWRLCKEDRDGKEADGG